ncbi:LysR substrate-binding domain-containing protein [Verrucomicrobiales bacterium]|nr:LysR substrate-binding domain-containing protein [Verrucomicrobiales bacterium]MDB4358993.1 LysR substrate-binding domain-containing protein [Verrucomicrobiales bacterium]
MEIRYFESLICVAEYGSIARAARKQNLTAAAVGQRIALLESHFDIALLDRRARSAVPTEACSQLLPLARHIVSSFHEMGAVLEPSGLSGKYSLGVIPTALTGILPVTIRRLAKLAPKLVLEIKPGTSETLFTELSDGKLDAVIIALPPFDLPDRFVVDVIREEPLVLLSKKSAGNSPREILENNPYICFDPRSWAGNGAVSYLKEEGIQIEPFYELDALEPIEKLVVEGMGVSLVPQWPDLKLNSRRLNCHVIKDRRYKRKMAMVTKDDSTRPQVLEVLRDSLKSTQR